MSKSVTSTVVDVATEVVSSSIIVGSAVGSNDGLVVGMIVDKTSGDDDGVSVFFIVGSNVGVSEGFFDGTAVTGLFVVGAYDGNALGDAVGNHEGSPVILVGVDVVSEGDLVIIDGENVGMNDG